MKYTTIKELIGSNQVIISFASLGEKWEETKTENGSRKYLRKEYRARLEHKERTAFFSYFTGSGIKKPEDYSLLWCIAMDATFFVNNDAISATFKEWADEYGYDYDSIKARDIFLKAQKSSKKLRDVLGGELFRDLMEMINEGIEE